MSKQYKRGIREARMERAEGDIQVLIPQNGKMTAVFYIEDGRGISQSKEQSILVDVIGN